MNTGMDVKFTSGRIIYNQIIQNTLQCHLAVVIIITSTTAAYLCKWSYNHVIPMTVEKDKIMSVTFQHW